MLTEIPGSSRVVDRGFVTYSDEAKVQMLGVDAGLIERHGAVSAQVARAMAAGALANSGGDIAVAITGIAGPDGSTAEKPVGLVYFALDRRGDREATLGQSRLGRGSVLKLHFGDIGRHQVRMGCVATALELFGMALTA